MPKVTYIEANGAQHQIDVPVGLSVMEGARRNSVPGIDADCGGACACATCHVYVVAEWQERTGAPAEDEAEMLECATEPGEGSRLSCQIRMSEMLDGLVVRLPVTQR